MSPTHFHTCLFCLASYYCEKPHKEMTHDGNLHQHVMHIREGSRCCPRCRELNIVACVKLRAYTVMPI
jgi:hypothetical protein